MKFLDNDQRTQVGFSYLIDNLNIMTPFGASFKKNILPFKKEDKVQLVKEFDNIDAIINSYKIEKSIYNEIERCFCRFKDISNSINRLKNNGVLDDIELFEIKSFALNISLLISAFNDLIKNTNLHDISFKPLDSVVELLDPDGKKLPTYHIYDSYSEILKEIRIRKRNIEDKILTSSDESIISQLKDDRLKIVIEEEEEELNIRKIICKKLINFTSDFYHNIIAIGKLDFLIAKSKLAMSFNGCRPTLNDKNEIHIKNAINPEISDILVSKNKTFTPVTISIKNGTTVITGANMGGKSVTLKTIVLNVLLGQMGFFMFCDEAHIPLLDFIYFISDDLQSVHQGLSTFGAEIINLKTVVEHSKIKNGFIVLDEFARGTNPKEGSMLVKALCSYLNKLNSISLISTHYDNVIDRGMVHYQVVGLKNLDFMSLKRKIDLNKTRSIEIIQEHMDYRLELVSNENLVPKDALNICILLGLEQEIIDITKTYYSSITKKED